MIYCSTLGEGMFRVVSKETKEISIVYDVRTDKTGYPHFLIYNDREWKYMSAKHFMPVVEEY